MTQRTELRALLLLGLLATGVQAATPRPVVLSGLVRAADAEAIYAPMADSSPIVLRYLAPEGTQVKPGDPLVRIDPGSALSQRETLLSQIVQTQARIAKEMAELAVAEIDAELALVDAEAALGKAKVDAAIPGDYIARIDADRYRGEFERADREFTLKQGELEAAREAVRRRASDAALEVDKLRTDLRFAEGNIASAEQKATTAGVIVYAFNPITGQRFEEGASAYSGNVVGEVIREASLSVRLHALEPDRRGLAEGQSVDLQFDAVPGRRTTGTIKAISGAPQPKAEWGSGRYFVIDIALAKDHGLPLRPGMSVRALATPAAAAPKAAP